MCSLLLKDLSFNFIQCASDEAERRKPALSQIKFCTVNDKISTYTYRISFKHPILDPVLPTGLSVSCILPKAHTYILIFTSYNLFTSSASLIIYYSCIQSSFKC